MHTLNLTTLSTRAILVKLTQSKPRTTSRNEAGEQILKAELGDDANRVSQELFKDPENPCRIMLNKHGELYRNHIKLTREDEPRGPRILVIAMRERYLREQRGVQEAIASLEQQYLPDEATYLRWVDMDISRRLAARSLLPQDKQDRLNTTRPITRSEYPTFDDFKTGLSSHHHFSTLPDVRHPLFDNSDEELASLREQMRAELEERERAIAESVQAQNRAAVAEPLKKLIDKLRIPAGQPGSIFRDSAVENVIEAVDLARQMCFGDPQIIEMCDDVQQALSGYARNPQVLRESPIVREQAAARLKAVADKMGWMMSAPTTEEAA